MIVALNALHGGFWQFFNQQSLKVYTVAPVQGLRKSKDMITCLWDP